MNIFLIGFMGCGKSTLAKKLASKTGYRLVDLDHEIERDLGQTVASFFAEKGENAFRELESTTLKSYSGDENSVIATGGGTPCFFDNMDWMNENGQTIYIEMQPHALVKRLEHGKAKRPLIKDLDEAALLHFIEQKVKEREPFYKKAKYIVNGINLTADDIKALFHT
jgi:shikimate kinase